MIAEMLLWLFILEVLSFANLPLTFVIFKNLKEKGYAFSKIIGLLIFSFITWYSSFLIKYNFGLVFSLLLMLFINIYILKSQRISFDKKSAKIIEIVFLSSFVVFCIIRSFTPAAEGLEKLFDMSLINGILQSEKMPPNDPWYSGHKINYYYFGHFIVATLTKISFLPSYVTFNLSLATIYSILAIEIFSITYNITEKLKFGFLGILLFLFLSNLLGFLQILTFFNPGLVSFFSDMFNIKYAMTCCHDARQNFLHFLLTFPVWSSTRVIPNTINEFPYANFMFGEVHSHILSLPIQLLLIGMLICLYKSKSYNFILIPFFSLVISAIYITNSWDAPIYFALFYAVNIILLLEKRIKFKTLLYSISLVTVGFVAFSLPYILTVNKKANFGFAVEKSNIFQELILFPVFIFSISYYYLKKDPELFLYILVFSSVIYFLTQIQIIVLLLPFIVFSLKAINNRENMLIHVLILLGSLVMLFPEIFFIDSRYNTVFKFYYHIWVFWSISSAFIIQDLRKDKAFITILLILIILSLPMTVFATIDRFNQGMNEGISLDGLKYMQKYHPDDYALLMWARKNINHNEIILEASGDAFTYTSIFSSYTGLQTPVGWNNHVGIHHNIWPEDRMKDVKTIYETDNQTLAFDLIKKYNISYVFVGSVELSKYSSINLTKFGDPVFSSGKEFIFEVS
jgi:YYY domain-containing protein